MRAAAGLLAEPRGADDPDVLDLGRTRLVTAWPWHLITSIRSRLRSLPGQGTSVAAQPGRGHTRRRTARRKTRHGLKPAACLAITDSHGELARSRRSASISARFGQPADCSRRGYSASSRGGLGRLAGDRSEGWAACPSADAPERAGHPGLPAQETVPVQPVLDGPGWQALSQYRIAAGAPRRHRGTITSSSPRLPSACTPASPPAPGSAGSPSRPRSG